MRRRRPWLLSATIALAALVAVVLPSNARPAFPGDNGKVAFNSDRDDPFGGIYTMNPDGSAVTRVDVGKTIESPAWSPDGTKLAFASKRDSGGVSFDDVYVLDIQSGNLRRLTTNFDTDFDPTWSPDGNKIAFVSDRDGNNEIYVMNADGTGEQRLTDNPGDDGDPAWSPEPSDNRIAFYSSRDGFFKEIYLMDANDGGNVRPLVERGFNTSSPSWSPDGTKIVFRRDVDGQGEIFSVVLANGVLRQLTDNVAQDSAPAWSPDGNKIVFVSRRDGNIELYVMADDGADPTRLTNNGAVDFEPDWQPVQPPPPPPGACITLSETAVSVVGSASTSSHRGIFGTDPDRLTITNCGTSGVHLAARGTDATGASANWQLTDQGFGSTCDIGLNMFRSSFALLLSGGGVGIGLSTQDRLLPGADGTTPFTLAAAARQEGSPSVEMPCVGSVGLGSPMTMNILLTAVAP